ncbi:hypothetical protein [Planctomicrobium piriforme]|uniref:Carboxypeptidase regulatory-like domain-containing protein n=1 Tax=Planctomicrobium piriforme TaxID=1576369 RepID=A0A1I3IEJ8_9PLAN|nr:hypothetical protein [Planctomicrobium piriforme]SFI46289.1 hypothetical protein SAMN05421753_10986 [Planctomicrobium piriforme]
MRQLINNFSTMLCSSLLCLVLAGCGGSKKLEFQQAAVKGAVSYKGAPLETGLIRFIPDTKPVKGQVAGKMAFANIERGTYSIPVERGATVGVNRIEIISNRETGKATQIENSLVKEVTQILPAKYNTESTLSVDVKPGENTQDFNLD